jgi:hypothetical protein
MIVSHQERLDGLGAALWFHGQSDAPGQQVVMRVPLGPYYALFGRGADVPNFSKLVWPPTWAGVGSAWLAACPAAA